MSLLQLLSRVQPLLTGFYRPSIVPSLGFKYKHVLQLRCPDCYFVVRDETHYVLCKTHPRHKQIKLKKKLKYLWTLTHATQGKQRPW